MNEANAASQSLGVGEARSAIAPKEVRYIKLGTAGRWADLCFERGELHFGYCDVPHEPCAAGDWQAIERRFKEGGRSGGKAKDATREIRDFYSQGPDCLWITFANRLMWWTFADPEVSWRGGDGLSHGCRSRRAIGGWRNKDLNGAVLTVDRLSTRLTQLAAYRQTICSVRDRDYLLRRLQGIEEPVVAKARDAHQAAVDIAGELIAGLHWSDFETLVDLIFSRSGWQRTSRVGETQDYIDLLVRELATNETAFVQVKSSADQGALDASLDFFQKNGTYERMFFVCHSPRGKLTTRNCDKVHVWTGSDLARMSVRAGLLEWLIEKSR